MKYLKLFLYFCCWMGAVISLVVLIGVGDYLLTAKIVILNDKIPYVEHIYGFGIGCMYLPIIDYWNKKQKEYE